MKIAVLGASRGLGFYLAEHIRKSVPESRLLLSSRKGELLKAQAREQDQICEADFSRSEGQEKILSALREFRPQRIFYVAGGGPYGRFEDKSWGSQAWALEVNLVFPARMLHAVLSIPEVREDLIAVTLVGSAVAGRGPDPHASAYAAAKHGLRGLVTSIEKESRTTVAVKIFEPGYMDTELLPANAWPRQQGLAQDPRVVAQELWQTSQ